MPFPEADAEKRTLTAKRSCSGIISGCGEEIGLLVDG